MNFNGALQASSVLCTDRPESNGMLLLIELENSAINQLLDVSFLNYLLSVTMFSLQLATKIVSP